MAKKKGPHAKASKHAMKEQRLQKENGTTNDRQVEKIDADTFEGEVDRTFKKHTANLAKKAGLYDSDSDEDLIQPMLPTGDDDDYEYADSDEEQTTNTANVKKQLVSLEKKKRKMDDSDDESDGDQAIVGTNDSSDEGESDDDDSNSDESDDDDNAPTAKVSTKQWKKGDFHEEQKKLSQKRKTDDEKERQYQEDEAAEAMEIQKRRANRLKQSEVLDDVFGDVLSNKKTKSSKPTTEDVVQSELTNSDKMKIIMKDAPELVDLFSELKKRLQTVRDQIHPLLSKVKAQQYVTDDGLSYLEVKLHLLLSYCTNIIFYMLLKSSGRSVKDHPVIDKLVEMRLLLEKIKPIDERMKSQISKLISLATAQGITQLSVEHRPRPGQLEDEDESDEEIADSEEDDVPTRNKRSHKPSMDLEDDEFADNDEEDDGSDDEDQVYTAPKLMPVAYDDATVKKAKKDMKRLENKIKNSEMIKAFKAEMSEEPEEMSNIGSEIKQSSLLKERDDYEEENFTRRNITKKEMRKIREERERTVDELRDLESFTDIDALTKYSKAKAATNTRVTLAHYIGDAEKAQKDLDDMNGSDEEGNPDDLLDEDEKYLRASGVIAEYSDSEEEEDDEDDEPTFKNTKNQNNKRARAGDDNSNKRRKNRAQIRHEEDAMLESDMRDEKGKRAASSNIIENKGLIARTKKDKKNPRIKHKMRYNKKAGSMLKMQKVQKGGQDGMVKSVRSSVVRSKKLKA